jgi:thioredoxin 1
MITNVTESTYQNEVQNHAGRVLIDFYTPTCPPCRAMAPVLDQIAIERADKLKIVKIDASTEYALAAQAGVSAVPTFVLMNGGVKKAQLTGLRSKKGFEKWLDEN